jgi:hypothetical protein
MRVRRSKLLVPAVALILTAAAIAGVWLLVGRSSASREAQLRISSLKLSLADLQSAPFSADPAAGSATASRITIRADEQAIAHGLTSRSQFGVSAGLLASGRSDLAAVEPVVTSVSQLAVQRGGLAAAGSRVPKLQGAMIARSAALSGVLDKISETDAARAAQSRLQTKLGAAASRSSPRWSDASRSTSPVRRSWRCA